MPNGRKIMIIGLDGATFDLIDPWGQAGLLPTLGRLLASGVSAPLRSTIPPVTPTAWSTMLTGCNPGKHGVYDFAEFTAGSYEPKLTNAGSLRVASMFQLASAAGAEIVAYNIPWTYPPEPVNGVMYSGYGAPAFDQRIASPAEAFADLQRMVSPEAFELPLLHDGRLSMAALRDKITQEGDMAVWLAANKPWDLYMCVFPATDHVGHIAFRDRRAREPEGGVIEDVLLETYRLVDAQIERLLEYADDNTTVLLVSDHGFGEHRGFVNINVLLSQLGLLRMQGAAGLIHGPVVRPVRTPAQTWLRHTIRRLLPPRAANRIRSALHQVDWERTRAVAYAPNPKIRLNLRGRDPLGIVSENQVPELEATITEALLGIKDPQTGQAVVQALHRGSELYPGARADEAPDLVVEIRDFAYQNVDIFQIRATQPHTAEAARRIRQRRHDNAGTHRLHGILIAAGAGTAAGGRRAEADLCDITPTALTLLGLPVPRLMDGRPLVELFPLVDDLGVVYTDEAPAPQPRCETRETQEDEAQVADRLRELGYI